MAALLAAALAAPSFADDKSEPGARQRVENTGKRAGKFVEKTAKRSAKFVEKTATRAGKSVEKAADKTESWVRRQTQ
ncbi:MAG: hypothetical protein ACREU1_10525 [Burkholderiales bacterium]